MKIVDYEIKIKFDKSKPEGTQRKLLDTTKIKKLDGNLGLSLKLALN